MIPFDCNCVYLEGVPTSLDFNYRCKVVILFLLCGTLLSLEGDIGVYGMAVLANFSCDISVLLILNSSNLRYVFSVRFGR